LLTLSDDGFRLELDGTLLTTRALKQSVAHSLSPASLERILGVADEGGTRLTLERCAYAGGHTRSDIWVGSSTFDRYWPRVVLVGEWFGHGEPLLLDSARLWLSSLHEWTVLSGFEPEWGLFLDPSITTVVQRYRTPRARRATLPDGTVVRLVFPLRERHSGLYTYEKTFTQDTHFELRFSQARDLEYVQRLVFALRNLLTLATGSSVNVTKLRGYREPLAGEHSPVGREVEIVYEHVTNVRARPAANHHDMIFTLADFQGSFRKHVLRWLGRTHDLGVVLELYFSTLHISSVYLETRFMNYVQAIEGYHRRRLNRTAYSTKDFDKYSARILEELHGEPRRIAKSSLRFANEISLERRIRDVLTLLDEPAHRIMLAGRTSADSFSKRVAGIRNDYAHAFDKPKPDPEEFVRLMFQLKALVEAVLLHEIGFEPRQISTMLEHANRYRMIRGH
jgi:hypothetical protein